VKSANQGFSIDEHIRTRDDFKKVFDRGKSSGNPYVVMYARQGDEKMPRIGWVLSRKVGKANVRNRIKRLIREVFRLNKGRLKAGTDIVLIPRSKMAELKKYRDAEAFLLKLWEKAGILKGQK